MAKFLDTTGVSYYLQQLINGAQERLVLISPYLKINERIKQSLEDKHRLKIDIRIIYGKNELQPEENNWLKSLSSVRTSFCKNLHAKCYLNEHAALITSMNLYEFSEVNNNEMGIYVVKQEDGQLYHDIYVEVQRLLRISDELQISVEKVTSKTEVEEAVPHAATVVETAYCISCKAEIKRNLRAPYCIKCYKEWTKIQNAAQTEKYCHACGREHGTSLAKPVCYTCFKQLKITSS
ncbi:MAG: phospholipase D family protein [Thiotrichaceae bacterium]